MSIDEFIKRYCNGSSITTNEYKRDDGLTMGCAGDMEIPSGFEEQIHWKDKQFRTVWINNKDIAMITFCEGDIIVMQYITQDAYDKEIAYAEKFYKTH